MKKVYLIWIWWIGISAVARSYNQNWWQVFWSDKYSSELIEKLKSEWIDIITWEDESRITNDLDLVIYTEAIPENQPELKKSKELKIKTLTYPQSLAQITSDKKLIAVSWSHWKSTTTSIISIILKNSNIWVNAVIWTILKEFDNKNAYFSNSEYFVIEACEYKRSFLNYNPFIWIITNIDLDHLDYYKDLADYESAFKVFLDNIKPNWYAVLNWSCYSSMKMMWQRKDINYIVINESNFILTTTNWEKEIIKFPNFTLQVPWEHIKFDAKIAFTVWKVINLPDDVIINSLEAYKWVWRRSEIVWTTKNWNILMSDYGHHPTEISLTLDALKQKYSDKKLFVIFQPHQYNRTLNLIEWFKNCFKSADTLIIPNIYESRDSLEDKNKLNTEKLIELINHPNKLDWKWLDNTLKLIEDYDSKNPNLSIILLQWAWNVDNLRYEISTN